MSLNSEKVQNCLVVFCLGSIILYLVLSLVLFIILAIFYGDADTNFLLDASSAVQYAAFAVSTAPITDIIRENACPAGYKLEPVGRFYGMDVGCNCLGWVRKTSCKKCSTISETPPFDFVYWDNSYFCIKRNSEVKYGLHSCPSGFQSCGDYTCVPKNEDCPITSVKLIFDGKVPNGYKGVALMDRILAFSNNASEGKLPLYKFQGVGSGAPCVSDAKVPPRQTSGDYILTSVPSGCGKYGADAWYSQVIDAMRENQYYKVNGVYGMLTSKYPGFADILSNEPVGLFARSTVRLYNEICANFDFKELISLTTSLADMNDSLKKLNKFALVISAVTAALVTLLMLSLIIQCCRGQEMPESVASVGLLLIPCLAAVSIVYNIVYAAFAISYEVRFNKNIGKISDLSGYSCFGQTGWTVAFKDFTDPASSETYRKCFTLPRFVLILIIFIIVSGVAVLCFLSKENRSPEFVRRSLSTGPQQNYQPQINDADRAAGAHDDHPPRTNTDGAPQEIPLQ